MTYIKAICCFIFKNKSLSGLVKFFIWQNCSNTSLKNISKKIFFQKFPSQILHIEKN